MSTLIVEVCEVGAVERHPHADRLAIATIKGWRTCIRFDPETGQAEFKTGDKCVYFPPDSVLPPELAHSPDKTCKLKTCGQFNQPVAGDSCPKCGGPVAYKDGTPGRLGIMAYLGQLAKGPDGLRPAGGRVKAARLRGEQSFGLIMRLDPKHGDDPAWPVGTDVKGHYGVTKWEPPLESTDGDAERPHPGFHAYTDIEHFGNYPGLLAEGEEVILTEKIHGKNCRAGLVLDSDAEGRAAWVWMAGSHGVRRKEFDAHGRRSEFWEVLNDNVRRLLENVRDEWPTTEPKASILIFGEIFGSGVQDMCYGLANGQRTFRAFDLAVNRTYLSFDAKRQLFETFGVPSVPVLYRGPFHHGLLDLHTAGPTTLCASNTAGKFAGREGVVITPVTERICEALIPSSTYGRLILKSVSADYLARREGTDSH